MHPSRYNVPFGHRQHCRSGSFTDVLQNVRYRGKANGNRPLRLTSSTTTEKNATGTPLLPDDTTTGSRIALAELPTPPNGIPVLARVACVRVRPEYLRRRQGTSGQQQSHAFSSSPLGAVLCESASGTTIVAAFQIGGLGESSSVTPITNSTHTTLPRGLTLTQSQIGGCWRW